MPRAPSPSDPAAPEGPAEKTLLTAKPQLAHTVQRKLDVEDVLEAEPSASAMEAVTEVASIQKAEPAPAQAVVRKRRSTLSGTGSPGPTTGPFPTAAAPIAGEGEPTSGYAGAPLAYPSMPRESFEQLKEAGAMRKKSPAPWIILAVLLALIALLIWWLAA